MCVRRSLTRAAVIDDYSSVARRAAKHIFVPADARTIVWIPRSSAPCPTGSRRAGRTTLACGIGTSAARSSQYFAPVSRRPPAYALCPPSRTCCRFRRHRFSYSNQRPPAIIPNNCRDPHVLSPGLCRARELSPACATLKRCALRRARTSYGGGRAYRPHRRTRAPALCECAAWCCSNAAVARRDGGGRPRLDGSGTALRAAIGWCTARWRFGLVFIAFGAPRGVQARCVRLCRSCLHA